ncbi:PHP domain-containing protein [bacterium]|nr:MAG: PHP domain-containing protein [bacterium]
MIGSKWRKWDLHFHTPSSYDYKNKAVTNQEIIDELTLNSIEAIAITDHHNIDIPLIQDLQRLGSGKITVFPGIEFRSELGGSESIHFIGVFPETCDLEDIWIKIQSQCELTKADVVRRGGDHSIYCDLKDTCSLIHRLGGITSIHAGEKSNTLENISNRTKKWQYKLAQKKDIILNSIDILELGKEDDKVDYETIVFPALGIIKPMIVCSDNHNIKKEAVNQNLWIKGDTTFEALKQIIYEPEFRVHIGETPPINPLLRIDKVSVNFPAATRFENESFCFTGKTEIKFSPNFTCIIGGRGTGKSTLLNLIHEKLKPGENTFFKYKKVKVEDKIAIIDDYIKIDDDQDEKYIEFLSQNEVEEFAQSYEKLTFAIYTRLLKQDEKGAILQKERELSEELQAYKRHTLDLTRIQSLKKELIQKQREIATSQKIVDSFTSADYVRISGELLSVTAQLSEIKTAKTALDKLKKDIREITSYNIVSESTNGYDLELNKIIKAINESLTNVDVQIISNADIELEQLELSKNDKQVELKNYLSEKGVNHESQNDIANANTIISQLSAEVTQKENDINALDAKLSRFDKSNLAKASQQYRNELESYIKKLSSTLENIDNSSIKPISLALELNVDAAKENAFENFKVLFKEKINQSNHKGDGVLRDILFCIHPEKITDKTALLEAITKCQSTSTAKSFLLQLFQDDASFEAYKCLCERNLLDYAQFKKIKVQYDKRPIETSSFGQRCTAVLVILLSLGNNPIIIDEPEAHLDSYLIANFLVDVIKKTKQNRQIIFATHNANFVINGDAELIHVLNTDNNNGETKIQSTTIENSATKEILVSLEGGKDAFYKRENKYQFE